MDIITAGSALTIANKLLGKTGEKISEDLANLYTIGRDRIINITYKKISNPEDGFQANLRVARDVFWNGSYTDDSISAEYFGGILASSRSIDGKDDRGIYYADIIKSLSSQQLLLHYIIYRSLNKLWISLPESTSRPDPGIMNELQNFDIWFSTEELLNLKIDVDKDLIALFSKGLIGPNYEALNKEVNGNLVYFTRVSPITLGVQLYAVAFNKLDKWKLLSREDFGEFENITLPQCYGWSFEDLSDQIKNNHS